MIIKSLSRKQPGLNALLRYIDCQAQDSVPLFWNLQLSALGPAEEVLSVFQRQIRCLKQRQNGNRLYHEILSLKKVPGQDLCQLRTALEYLLVRYLQQRAPEMMGYARLHAQAHHLHIHLVLTANAIGQTRPIRLSKSQFSEIHKQLETELLLKFPEIQLEPVFTKALPEIDDDFDR